MSSSSDLPSFVQSKGRHDKSLKATVVSIFDIPPEFQDDLATLVTKDDSETIAEEVKKVSVGEGYPVRQENSGPSPTAGQHNCSKCNVSFETAEEFREHVRSEWHVHNIKLSVAGKPPISEAGFKALHADDEKEGAKNNEESDEPDSSDSEDEEESDSEDEHEDPNAISADGSRRAVVNALVYRCWDAPSYTLAVPSCVNDHVGYLPTYFDGCHNDHVGVILLRSGRFAGAVYSGGRLVYHRTKKRYTVRAKAGGAQSAHDTSSGKAKSAGAMLRRYGEKAMSDDLQEIFSTGEFAKGLQSCSRIYLSVGRSLRHLVTQSGSVLAKEANPPPIVRLPVPVQRPTIEAATTAFQQIHCFIFADATGWQKVQEKIKPEPKKVGKPKEKTKVEEKPKEPEGPDEFFTELHQAAQDGNAAKVTELLNSGMNPASRDIRGRAPYQLANTKASRDAFRKWRGEHENDENLEFIWEDSLIPDAITDETLEAKKAKEKEKQKVKKARQKAKKSEEKAKADAEQKKKDDEEAARLAAHPDKKCDNCGSPLPKKPFYALNYAYKSIECLKEHKRKLQLARFDK